MSWRQWAAQAAAVVVALGTTIGIASAANGPTQIPPFVASHHLRVDPQLTQEGFQVPGNLESQIVQAGSRQNLQVYEVIVEKGTETYPRGTQVGQVIAQQVYNNWASQQGFPSDRCEIIVVVRAPNGGNRVVGMSPGVVLCSPQQRVLGGAVAAQQTTESALSQNFPMLKHSGGSDWTGFSVGVVNYVNSAIGHAASASQAAPQAPMASSQPSLSGAHIGSHPVINNPAMPSAGHGIHIPLIVWLILLLLVVAAILFFLSNSARAAYLQATKKTKPVTDNLGTQVASFKLADGGMAAGKRVFSGASLKRYQQGLLHSGKYFLFSPAVEAQLKRINATAPAGVLGMFCFWSWNSATALVGQELVIDTKELPDELVTATSGKLVTTKATFTDAVAILSSEFDAAKADFLVITQAFDKASADKRELIGNDDTKMGGLIGQIEEKKDETVAAGMAWNLFAAEHDDVLAQVAKLKDMLKITGGDPLGALALSSGLKARASQLLLQIAKGVDMQKHVAEVATAITAAHKQADDARQAPVDFVLVRKAAAENWRLDEEGGNPTPFLTTADQEFVNMKTLLAAGKVEDADTAKGKALAAAQAATSVVQTVQAAKAELDKEGAALQTHFGADSGFEAITSLYAQQRFLAAHTAMQAFQCLADTQKRAVLVKAQIEPVQATITTATTDSAYATAGTDLDGVIAAAKQPNANWVKVKELADAADRAYAMVVGDIQTDVANHTAAVSEVGALRAAYNAALAVAQDQHSDPAHRTALQGVGGQGGIEQSITGLERSLQTPKSDWKAIAEQANSALASIDEIKQAAQHDIEVDQQYKQELDDAQTELNGFGSRQCYRQFGGGPRFSFNPVAVGLLVAAATEGASLWQQAEGNYASRHYEGMQHQLDNLHQSLWDANSQANWYLLQDMYNSGDPVCVHYAQTQGYQQGVPYSSWEQTRFGNGNIDYGQMWEPTPVDEWRPQPDSGLVQGSDSSGNDTWVPAPEPTSSVGDDLSGNSSSSRDDSASTRVGDDLSGGGQEEQDEPAAGDDLSGGGSDPAPDVGDDLSQ